LGYQLPFSVKNAPCARPARLRSRVRTTLGLRVSPALKITRSDSTDIPSRIEVGGSVMPVLKGELL
jgi:hypothetical protein